jgi:hypothetical protein
VIPGFIMFALLKINGAPVFQTSTRNGYSSWHTKLK